MALSLLTLRDLLEKTLKATKDVAVKSVMDLPQIRNISTGIDVAKGFAGQLNANQAQVGGQNFNANPSATYTPQNSAQYLGSKALGLANDLTYWQMSGFNEPFDIGLRAISPYAYKVAAPALDRLSQLSSSGRKILADIVERAPKFEWVSPAIKSESEFAGRTAAKGLFSETPAQTAFRRSAGVTPQEAYRFMPEPPPAPISEFTPVTKKVNFLDYYRSPENVLEKIGLGEQSRFLRQQFESYQKQLPEELSKVSKWIQEAPAPESSKKIFQYLDGKISSTELQPVELKVASEIQNYLKTWAVKLKLPPERQISSYITHIFERDKVTKEFPDELAKLIDRQVAGSVYNPFLEQRQVNDLPYIQDVWRALEAYIKRATRAYNIDPALQSIKQASLNLEKSQVDYLEKLTARINLRPTETDSLIDNLIKSIPGVGYRFGQRPTTVITQTIRQQIYRGSLGLNVSSAVRNLSQISNTYAKLGERWTLTGYLKLLKNYNSPELESVLTGSFVEDRKLSVMKQTLQQIDKGLFFLFEHAERINRGAAYFGAKSKALSEGKTESEAISYAKELVRKTQFQFSSIDTPVGLQSDLAKTLTQFGSYSIKQIEFLGEMVKNKEYLGIIRYIGSTLALMKVYQDHLGIKLDLLPQLGLSPTVKAVTNIGPAVYGNDQTKSQARKELASTALVLVPGGIQGKKSIQGLGTYQKGYAETPSGNISYPIEQNVSNLLKGGLFGKSAFPETQRYYNEELSPLGKNQSQLLKNSTNIKADYEKILATRRNQAQLEDVKSLVQQSGTPTSFNDYYIYLDKQGNTQIIDTSWFPQKPDLTGNPLLDKKLTTKYHGEVTSKTNDIVALFEAGAISKDEAEAQLAKLETQPSTSASSSAKAPKNLPVKTSVIKFPVKSSKLPKMLKIKALKRKRAKFRYSIATKATKEVKL